MCTIDDMIKFSYYEIYAYDDKKYEWSQIASVWLLLNRETHLVKKQIEIVEIYYSTLSKLCQRSVKNENKIVLIIFTL